MLIISYYIFQLELGYKLDFVLQCFVVFIFIKNYFLTTLSLGFSWSSIKMQPLGKQASTIYIQKRLGILVHITYTSKYISLHVYKYVCMYNHFVYSFYPEKWCLQLDEHVTRKYTCHAPLRQQHDNNSNNSNTYIQLLVYVHMVCIYVCR